MIEKFCCHINRRHAEQLRNMGGTVCISISDVRSEAPLLRHGGFDDLLSLRFDDLTHGSESAIAAGFIPPAREHAEQIVAFIERHNGKSIIAHCEAGISRSAAVCRFLHERGWTYRKVHADMKFANPLLYSMLVEVHDAEKARSRTEA